MARREINFFQSIDFSFFDFKVRFYNMRYFGVKKNPEYIIV